MLRISVIFIVLQSSIDKAGNNGVDGGESDGNKTNLSILSLSKKFIEAGYPMSKGAKKSNSNLNKGNTNTKKGIKVTKSSNYLTSSAKKTFNLL